MMDVKWGVYPWFVECGVNLIHPDDLEAFMQEASNTKAFKCVGEGDYIILEYNSKCYRVKDKLFKMIPTPKYDFGENIIIKKNEEEAVVTDIMWHYAKKEHYYFVSIKNKKRSRRYFETEFV